jgi:DNA-binding MarR family transcriptional regulator
MKHLDHPARRLPHRRHRRRRSGAARNHRTEDLTHSQYVAPWTLCLADDADVGIPVSAVSDGLLNRASDTTRLLDRLEKAGLVERRRSNWFVPSEPFTLAGGRTWRRCQPPPA